MSPAVRARHRIRWEFGLCAVALVLAPLGANAELWLIESSLNSGFESNDNLALAQASPGRVNTLSLSTSLNASRQLENSVTRMKADITALREHGPGAENRIDAQLALTKSLSDPLNSVDFALQYSQDFNNVVKNADVTLEQGQRRTTLLSAAWSHALSERLSANTRLSVNQTRYGQQLSGAVDYRDSAASAGLSYGLTETTTMGLQTSYSTYRPVDNNNESKTSRAGMSVSRVLSDRTNGSVNFGGYRTVTTASSASLACPLAAAYCNAGYVPFVIVTESNASSLRGLEVGASLRYQFNETTDSALGVARQQVPSGAGTLVRSDTVSAALNRSFSPTLAGAMNVERSRSAFQKSTNAAQPGRSTFSLSLTKQLATDLSLQTRFQRSRSDDSALGNNARSNSLSVSLKYDGPRIDSSR